MSATTLRALNTYEGDNIWEDVIYGLDYDEEATAAVASVEGRDFVAGGIHYTYAVDEGEWVVAAATDKLRQDEARAALGEAGERRSEAERLRAAAMLDTETWVRRGRDAGLSISEMARITGLTRVSIYALLDE